MKTSRVRIIIKGIVQGVGFRYFCYRKAIEYSISGFAKNLTDGSVEVHAQGEKSHIEDFIEQLKTGPINSSIKSVYVEELDSEENSDEFKIF